MKVKEEREQAGLKFSIHKMKIGSSSPITSWQIDEDKVEIVADFLFLGSEITVDGDCSHEIKRCLLLGRKVMTNPGSILKSRDFTLPTKIIVFQSSNCVQPFASLVDSSTPGFPVLHCSQSGQRSTQSKLWFFQ